MCVCLKFFFLYLVKPCQNPNPSVSATNDESIFVFVEFSLALDATVYCPKKMLLSLERIRSSRACGVSGIVEKKKDRE